jgi:hypothetical protein
LRRERQVQDSECRALRTEKEYWQQQSAERSAERTEGIEAQDKVLLASLHSLRVRLCHLTDEARSCRLLEESGSAALGAGQAMEASDSSPCGTIDSGLQEALVALNELENELIPIVSRLHASLSRPVATAPASSLSEADKILAAAHAPKISLSAFEENDLALFFPTPKGDYLAFNCGAPHHYLSAESKVLIGQSLCRPPPPSLCSRSPHLSPGQDKHFRKIYVLGKIIFKEERVATASDSPFHLAPGVKYYEVSVASITSQLSS